MITPGCAGAPFTTSVRARLVPQLLVATTDRVQVVNVPLKLILTLLKLFGPLTVAPEVVVQRYPVACATGVIEYETPV